MKEKRTSNGKLAALERKGIIHRGSRHLPKNFFKEKLRGKRARVLEALLEERGKGR
jgi:hypothetical protein